MDDRELLEAAANATGHAWRWVKCPKFGDTDVPGMRAHDRVNGVEYWPGWNPLTDDGDALRLDALEAASSPDRWIVAHNTDSFTVYLGYRKHATRKALREAIDAARKEHP